MGIMHLFVSSPQVSVKPVGMLNAFYVQESCQETPMLKRGRTVSQGSVLETSPLGSAQFNTYWCCMSSIQTLDSSWARF